MYLTFKRRCEVRQRHIFLVFKQFFHFNEIFHRS
jgi:hypothetical protein